MLMLKMNLKKKKHYFDAMHFQVKSILKSNLYNTFKQAFSMNLVSS